VNSCGKSSTKQYLARQYFSALVCISNSVTALCSVGLLDKPLAYQSGAFSVIFISRQNLSLTIPVEVWTIAAVTMLLSLSVYQIIVSEKLPTSSSSVPIIGQFVSIPREFHKFQRSMPLQHVALMPRYVTLRHAIICRFPWKI